MTAANESVSIEVWPSEDGRQQIFSLRGSLDIATAPSVKASLLDAADTGNHQLVVDLSQIEFLDSTGLGTLIGSNKRAKEAGGELRIVSGDGQILRLLRITGLLAVLAVYPTLDAAISGSERISDGAPFADAAAG